MLGAAICIIFVREGILWSGDSQSRDERAHMISTLPVGVQAKSGGSRGQGEVGLDPQLCNRGDWTISGDH